MGSKATLGPLVVRWGPAASWGSTLKFSRHTRFPKSCPFAERSDLQSKDPLSKPGHGKHKKSVEQPQKHTVSRPFIYVAHGGMALLQAFGTSAPRLARPRQGQRFLPGVGVKLNPGEVILLR